MPECFFGCTASRPRAKAIRRPSGDQAGDWSLPCVTYCNRAPVADVSAIPLPKILTAMAPLAGDQSGSPIWARKRIMRVLPSSTVTIHRRPPFTKAIRLPSGDQVGAAYGPSAAGGVRIRSSLPSEERTAVQR
jgi:hypothetical protein